LFLWSLLILCELEYGYGNDPASVMQTKTS
jgi:hypothetical protein